MYTFERFYYFRPYRGKSNYWLNRYGMVRVLSLAIRKPRFIRQRGLRISDFKFTKSMVGVS